MASKTKDELDKTLDQIKTDVFTSLSNIQLLSDLSTLIDENNRVVMGNPVLFKSLIREFQLSLSIKLERILENGPDKENINHAIDLAKYFQHSLKDEDKEASLSKAFHLIAEVKDSDTTKHNREFRNNIYAHSARDKSTLKGLAIKYDDYKATYEKLGEALNLISGAYFSKGTVMRIVSDDRTIDQFRSLEKAEEALIHLEVYDSEHPAINHIDKLKKKKND